MRYNVDLLTFFLWWLYACVTDNRREKSLGLLTQNFIKLFICSQVSEKARDLFLPTN